MNISWHETSRSMGTSAKIKCTLSFLTFHLFGEAQERPISTPTGGLVDCATGRSGSQLEQDIPARRLAHKHDVFEFTCGQRPMPAHFDQSDILNVKPVKLDIRSIARLVVDRIEVGRLLKSRLAPFTFQELPIRAVEMLKHLLTSRHIQQSPGGYRPARCANHATYPLARNRSQTCGFRANVCADKRAPDCTANQPGGQVQVGASEKKAWMECWPGAHAPPVQNPHSVKCKTKFESPGGYGVGRLMGRPRLVDDGYYL